MAMRIDNSDGRYLCCWCFEPLTGTGLYNAPWGKRNKVAMIHINCALSAGSQAANAINTPASVVEFDKKPIWSSEDPKDV